MYTGQRLPFSLKRHGLISATTNPYHWIQYCLNVTPIFLPPVLMSLKYLRFGYKNKHVKDDYLLMFFVWVDSPSGPKPPDRLISISQSDTLRSVGLLFTSDRLITQTLPDNTHTQHSRQTDNHAPGGRNPSKQAAADPRLRPHAHWDRHRGTKIPDVTLLDIIARSSCTRRPNGYYGLENNWCFYRTSNINIVVSAYDIVQAWDFSVLEKYIAYIFRIDATSSTYLPDHTLWTQKITESISAIISTVMFYTIHNEPTWKNDTTKHAVPWL